MLGIATYISTPSGQWWLGGGFQVFNSNIGRYFTCVDLAVPSVKCLKYNSNRPRRNGDTYLNIFTSALDESSASCPLNRALLGL
jgi:hypothetical protein